MTKTFLQTSIDKSWTLFLDRDGVINEELIGSYVTEWDEFRFCKGALPALKHFSRLFGTILVVSNQRGVGRGIMSLDTLKDIHKRMTTAITEAGGRIDKVYAATAVSDTDRNRKPNVGMGLQAKEDFPAIDFKKSVMVGNSLSDMEFGKRLAMRTVFLTTKLDPQSLPDSFIDEQYPSLAAWSETLMPATLMG